MRSRLGAVALEGCKPGVHWLLLVGAVYGVYKLRPSSEEEEAGE